MEEEKNTGPRAERMDTREAARYLGVATQTLVNWRAQGKGPAYIRYARGIHYTKRDLDKFVERSRYWPKQPLVMADDKRGGFEAVDLLGAVHRDAGEFGLGLSPTSQQITTLSGVEVLIQVGRDVQRLADAAERIADSLAAGRKK